MKNECKLCHNIYFTHTHLLVNGVEVPYIIQPFALDTRFCELCALKALYVLEELLGARRDITQIVEETIKEYKQSLWEFHD